MADFHKFNVFALQLGQGVHHLHAGGDTLQIYLTNDEPSATLDAVKADLAEIAEQGDYAAADVQNDYTETDGTGTFVCEDKTWLGGVDGFGPFRYVVLFNSNATDDPLIGWWDYGASITVNEGETFKVDFGPSVLTIS